MEGRGREEGRERGGEGKKEEKYRFNMRLSGKNEKRIKKGRDRINNQEFGETLKHEKRI